MHRKYLLVLSAGFLALFLPVHGGCVGDGGEIPLDYQEEASGDSQGDSRTAGLSDLVQTADVKKLAEKPFSRPADLLKGGT